MGQSWLMVDLDGRTSLRLGKLGECLPYERTTAEFLSYLLLPPKDAYKARRDSPSKEQVKKWLALCPPWSGRWARGIDQEERTVATTKLQPIRASLQTMPADIHLLIFDLLDEFVDVLCLALASVRMFKSGERRILATSKGNVPWAGHRLICIGSYLKTEDIPHGLLTSEEQEELKQNAKDDRLYNHAGRFQRVEKERPLSPFGLCQTRINYDVFMEIVKWLGDDKVKVEYDQLILRNLTKRQYVCADSTSTDLGTVLLARICWSSDPSCAMAYDGHDLTRGVWAGDRFDITTLDRLEEGMGNTGVWTDVSKEVADEMARIWESEYGEGWEDKDRW